MKAPLEEAISQYSTEKNSSDLIINPTIRFKIANNNQNFLMKKLK